MCYRPSLLRPAAVRLAGWCAREVRVIGESYVAGLQAKGCDLPLPALADIGQCYYLTHALGSLGFAVMVTVSGLGVGIFGLCQR